jgi:type VI secretion system protein ImpM
VNQLGYYGKTPHHGDFVRFNLPQSFIKVWDDWLQQIMINGESQSQSWPTQYAQAPAYRFVLSGGIAGNTPWIGILKTSQDKEGRRFPFCLALSLPEHELPCVSVSTKALWFDEAEALLTRVAAREYNFDDLQGELALLAKKHTKPSTPTASPISLASTQSSGYGYFKQHCHHLTQGKKPYPYPYYWITKSGPKKNQYWCRQE